MNFVPSPFTPTNVELVYSAQEDITVVRWRVAAAPPVAQTRFELLGTDGTYSPIDFSRSAFAGGIIACTDGTGSCAQYIVRGKYDAAGTRPVRAVHDVYGDLPGVLVKKHTDEVPETISFNSFFHPGNDVVYLNITDAIADHRPYKFPRTFEHGMWETNGLCVSDVIPSDVSFSPVDQTGGFAPPQPLSDRGIYCVGTRPVPADGGDSTLLQKRIATLPQIVPGAKTYTPTVEKSPIVYQIILDLEIPVPDRCADAIQKIDALVQRYFGNAGVPVHQLPTINLSGDPVYPCSQSNDRVIHPTEIAQAAKQLITTLEGPHQQFHFMYFNNLDAPLPSALRNSFEQLFETFSASPAGYKVSLYSWLFSPIGAAVLTQPRLEWWAFWVWQAPDMNFEMELGGYVQKKLPYTTQEHDPTEPVPLLDPSEVAQHEGDWIKICTSSPPVLPHGQLPTPHDIFAPSWQITTADPPTYLVTLPNQITVDGSSFVEADANVTYQICTRYCDDEHPYVDTAGTGRDSWKDSEQCAALEFK